MRFLLIFLFSLSFTQCKVPQQTAQTEGVKIIDKMDFYLNDKTTLTQVVDKAISEDKLIFVDIYADWCTPCKMMDEDVFSDDDLSDFMKENFVNYKVDGEKHNGPNLGVMFGVGGYPTLLILDQKGRVIERNDGALYHSGLKRMAKEAIKIADRAS